MADFINWSIDDSVTGVLISWYSLLQASDAVSEWRRRSFLLFYLALPLVDFFGFSRDFEPKTVLVHSCRPCLDTWCPVFVDHHDVTLSELTLFGMVPAIRSHGRGGLGPTAYSGIYCLDTCNKVTLILLYYGIILLVVYRQVSGLGLFLIRLSVVSRCKLRSLRSLFSRACSGA